MSLIVIEFGPGWMRPNSVMSARYTIESNGPFTIHSYSYDASSKAYSLRAGFPVVPNSD